MIVDPEVLSTDKLAGEGAIVDTVAETAPMVKVTVAVAVKATLSVTSLAEIVFEPTTVDFIMAVA